MKTTNQTMETCTVPGCNQSVSKPGHKLCYEHWKANNLKVSNANTSKSATLSSSNLLLSTTKISEQLGLSRNKINPILAELGLLDKVPNGWLATRLGLSFGAVQKHEEKNNKPYVLWPEEILNNQIFVAELRKTSQHEDVKPTSLESNASLGFREKFQAGEYRTTDGHWVRSKAELAIDNWLYMADIVHAYERKLPVEEEVFCDFYIPSGKVYIEYWGYEKEEYLSRKREKQRIYQKYEFN